MKNKSYWLLLAVVLILLGDNIYVSYRNNKDDERISQLERQLGHEVTKEFEAEWKCDSLKEKYDSIRKSAFATVELTNPIFDVSDVGKKIKIHHKKAHVCDTCWTVWGDTILSPTYKLMTKRDSMLWMQHYEPF